MPWPTRRGPKKRFSTTPLSRAWMPGHSPLRQPLPRDSVLCFGAAKRVPRHLIKFRPECLVHAIDLSAAVEANRKNVGERSNYVVAQADLSSPPFPKAVFDVVIGLGMIQHTPSPEKTIESLYALVKPGGLLVVDHYTRDFSSVTKLAPVYRRFLKEMSPERSKRITDKLVRLFFPLHWAVRKVWLAQMLLSRISPCLVYFRSFPQLSREQHYEWCQLDTYDHLTDYYKHFRTCGQIRAILARLGAGQIETWRGGNGVEGRCRKPQAPSVSPLKNEV